ncbi:MAG: hypothetical protein FWC26_11290 [Fibromonadales bacterium]|nr:hypothetical protein [Fibromonadales bacterium]
MNHSKLLVSSLFIAGLAFAQNSPDLLYLDIGAALDTSSLAQDSSLNQEPEPPPPPPPPPPMPMPEPAKAAPVAENTIFGKLRGHSYNPYSTVGAASTVHDLVATPSDIYGQKFFYVSPSDFLGYTAFDMLGGSALLGLDNSELGNLATLVLGYANSSFGIALNYSVSKTWYSDDDYSRRTTLPGDNIGISFSIPFGTTNFYVNAGWLTYAMGNATDDDGDETKEDYSTIDAVLGITNTSGAFRYNIAWGLFRNEGSYTDEDGKKAVDEDTFLLTALMFNFGYAALQSENAKVIVGLNNAFGVNFIDEVNNVRKGDKMIFVVLAPNILGEIALFDNLFAFAGATHSLTFMSGDLDSDKETSLFVLTHDPETQAFAGVRFQRANWALEAQVSANPFEVFGGNNIFANFGGFIYF